MKTLRSELQEHRVNAIEGNPRKKDPKQKGRQNATRFCNYCRTNGHTPSWCCKKIRDEDLRRIETERTAEKKSRLLRSTTKNEDQTMDQNDGLLAKISKDEIKTTLSLDLQRIPPPLNRISLRDQASHMGTTIRTMEDLMINAQISHSIEAMEIDLKTAHPTIRMGTGETMEDFLVLHRLKGETFHKIVHTASQEVINLTILPSEDLTVDLRLALRLTNKNFHKAITRRLLMCSASPQPLIPSTINQSSVR